MSLPAISQHLSVLCEAGLVSDRRDGRQRFYRLNPEPLKQVSDWGMATIREFYSHISLHYLSRASFSKSSKPRRLAF